MGKLIRFRCGEIFIEYLVENKNFIRVKDNEFKISTAAILLFVKNPQTYFPRARIRFIKYQGNEEKYGQNLNVIKDKVLEISLFRKESAEKFHLGYFS